MTKLLLGVAREIITPKIGARLHGYSPDVYSTSVADDLTATAFYFEQGDKKALMISATVCSIRSDLAQRILNEIEESCGIPKEHCMLSAIHTHSGPGTNGSGRGWGDVDWEYCESIFIPGILSAVKQAMKNPSVVTIGIGIGNSLVGVNRRELNDQNRVELGQCRWGCFNPQMTIISFKNEQNKVVANIIHYGAHGTAAGKNHEITRDWPGVMVDELEKVSGGITAFFNGAEGDVGPRLSNGKTTGNLSYVYELGKIAARDAVNIYSSISDYNPVGFSAVSVPLNIPLSPKMPRSEAEAIYEKFKNDTVNLNATRRQTALDIMKAWDDGEPDLPCRTINQTFIRFGDLVMAGFPFELFSQISMRIDDAFADQTVLTLSLTNGTEGYFITEDSICHGGYEVEYFHIRRVQPFVRDADYHLIKETVANIKDFIGG